MKGDYTIKSRELFGIEVWQKTKDSFFCVTDLVNAGNKVRNKNREKSFNLSAYLNNKQTKEFINELETKYKIKPFRKGTSKKSKSYAHPLLFVDIALAIDPKLKIEVYEWLLDELVKYRVQSGDKYNIMCGVLWKYTSDKNKFKNGIRIVANRVKELIGVDNWDYATQKQLENRDYLYTLIADFTETTMNSNLGFSTAVALYKKKYQI